MSDIKRVTTPFSYASAVAAGDYVFLGLHRGSGDTFAAQFDGTMAAIQQTLQELGLELESIVKVHVWLRSIKDLPEMEQRFTRYYAPDTYPARMTATTEFIDDDCLLMIEGVAYRGA